MSDSGREEVDWKVWHVQVDKFRAFLLERWTLPGDMGKRCVWGRTVLTTICRVVPEPAGVAAVPRCTLLHHFYHAFFVGHEN